MKRVISSFVVMCFFVSCKKEIKENNLIPQKVDPKISVSEECYSYVIKKDTILMHLNFKENKLISGNLIYNLYEKDKNEGLIEGEIKGDTLFADYTFKSEGVLSVRELVFLKQGNDYVEGYGEIVDNNNGKISFKDKKEVKFDGRVLLTKIECK